VCFPVLNGVTCLDDLTTRIDSLNDSGLVDMGFHFPEMALPTVTPTQPPTGSCDYFDQPDTSTINEWTKRAGNWQVASNRLQSASGNVISMITHDGPPVANGCVEAQIICGPENEAGNMGFLVRYNSFGENIRALLRDSDGDGDWDGYLIIDDQTQVGSASGMSLGSEACIQLPATVIMSMNSHTRYRISAPGLRVQQLKGKITSMTGVRVNIVDRLLLRHRRTHRLHRPQIHHNRPIQPHHPEHRPELPHHNRRPILRDRRLHRHPCLIFLGFPVNMPQFRMP